MAANNRLRNARAAERDDCILWEQTVALEFLGRYVYNLAIGYT